MDDRIATAAACTTIGMPANERNRDAILTTGQWNQLARWLQETGQRPGDLLFSGAQHQLDHAQLDPGIIRKARSIEERASDTLRAMESLQESGIWVRCRADSDYPARWKKRLRSASPPVVFGLGPTSLLDASGVAIVGSREITKALAETATAIGRSVIEAGSVVISGAARGTDRFGMMGALETGGRSVGVLAGNLARTSRQGDLQDYIAADRLCLISHVHPSAGFTVGNAMARNRLIYALADVAIVVSATEETGGTWTGAIENLNRQWAPMAVWSGTDAPLGNTRLIERGAFPLMEVPVGYGALDRLIEAASIQSPTSDNENTKSPRLIQESGVLAY